MTPPPDDSGPSRDSGAGRRPAVIGLVVAALLLALSGGWFLMRPVTGAADVVQPAAGADDSYPDDPAAEPALGRMDTVAPQDITVQPPIPTFEPEPELSVDGEVTALQRLEELSGKDLAGVTLDGRYVAQLASKSPGIHDPIQVTVTGSHIFRATDILAEHQSLRDDPANGDARVVLLRSTDFGQQQLYRGAPLYVTFALRDFGSAADVHSWCAGRFPGLSPEELANQCADRRLRPPDQELR